MAIALSNLIPSITTGLRNRSGLEAFGSNGAPDQVAVFEYKGSVKSISMSVLMGRSQDIDVDDPSVFKFSDLPLSECSISDTSQTRPTKDFDSGYDGNPDTSAPTAMVYSNSLRRWVDAVISEELSDGQDLDDPQVIVQYQDPVTGVCRKRMSIHSDNLDVGVANSLDATWGSGPLNDKCSQQRKPRSGDPGRTHNMQRCRQLQAEALSQEDSEASEYDNEERDPGDNPMSMDHKRFANKQQECDPGGVSLPDPAYLLRAPPPSQQEMQRQAQQNYLQRPDWDVQGRQRQIEASRADGAVAGGRAGLGVERRNFGGEREEELRRQRRQMRSFG